MTINTKTLKPALIAADGTTPLTPEEILDQLRVLRLHVPDFGPLAVSELVSLRVAASVPIDMIAEAINTIGASQSVESAIGKKPADLLEEQEEALRWSAVEAELRTMLSGVAAANLSRRYRLGLTTLQTYNITRQLVRQKEHADLLPHFESMRKVNRFGRGRRRPAAVVPPPVPAPVPVPKAT